MYSTKTNFKHVDISDYDLSFDVNVSDIPYLDRELQSLYSELRSTASFMDATGGLVSELNLSDILSSITLIGENNENKYISINGISEGNLKLKDHKSGNIFYKYENTQGELECIEVQSDDRKSFMYFLIDLHFNKKYVDSFNQIWKS